MKPRTNGTHRAHKSQNFQGEGPNWILIAGGALLSMLSVRLGYKLKQVLDARQQDRSSATSKGNGTEKRRSGSCALHSNHYAFTQNGDGCYSCLSGISEGVVESKRPPSGSMLKETDMELPSVTIPAPESNRENGVMWASSPDHLELPQKPFHYLYTPRLSESGSDIFSKQELMHKLRQRLKRRIDKIREMQDKIMELQTSLSSQISHSNHLQAQFDAANRDLFDSEREIKVTVLGKLQWLVSWK